MILFYKESIIYKITQNNLKIEGIETSEIKFWQFLKIKILIMISWIGIIILFKLEFYYNTYSMII